jgi:hypothetical protein
MRGKERQLHQQRISRGSDVHVHVPEARDEILAAPVYDSRVGGQAGLRRRPNGNDAIALDQNGVVLQQPSSFDVDHSDMRDRNVGVGDWTSALCGSAAGEKAGDEEVRKASLGACHVGMKLLVGRSPGKAETGVEPFYGRAHVPVSTGLAVPAPNATAPNDFGCTEC